MIQFLLKLMGDPHEKKIKAIMPIIEHINALEPEFEKHVELQIIQKQIEF